jgi:hypothetical protein
MKCTHATPLHPINPLLIIIYTVKNGKNHKKNETLLRGSGGNKCTEATAAVMENPAFSGYVS